MYIIKSIRGRVNGPLVRRLCMRTTSSAQGEEKKKKNMLGSVLRESGPIKRKQSTGRPRILPRLAPADKKRAKEKKKIYTHKRETVVLFHNPQLEMYIILYVYKKKEAAAAAGALAARLSSVNTLATVYSKTLYNRRRLMTL